MPSDLRPARYDLIHGKSETTHTALCVLDECPWKYRGITGELTLFAAGQHTAASGHSTTVYESIRSRVVAGPLLEVPDVATPVGNPAHAATEPAPALALPACEQDVDPPRWEGSE